MLRVGCTVMLLLNYWYALAVEGFCKHGRVCFLVKIRFGRLFFIFTCNWTVLTREDKRRTYIFVHLNTHTHIQHTYIYLYKNVYKHLGRTLNKPPTRLSVNSVTAHVTYLRNETIIIMYIIINYYFLKK